MTINMHASELRRKQRELDDAAATLASRYKLWDQLLPRKAYPPGRLVDAVIQTLEGRQLDDGSRTQHGANGH